jgi:mRNA-degrading endonuclease RelE of RelBE toxin-antitoxin system
MKVKFTEKFSDSLLNQVEYISADKPKSARKFKSDLLRLLRKDLKNPFHFKKSIYFDDENIRDYVFKGYVSVYKVDVDQHTVTVFGFIKYREIL